MSAFPVKIVTDERVRGATALVRYQERLSIVVVAKATFRLIERGRAVPIEPDPIVADDRTFGRLRQEVLLFP